MKQHLSVSAIPGPPVVTTIVPRTRTSLATGVRPSWNRRTMVLLENPFNDYPPPVPPTPPAKSTLTIVLIAVQERRVADIRRRTLAGVRAPRFVRPSVQFPGPTLFTQPPRRVLIHRYRLFPPAVVFVQSPFLAAPVLRRVTSRRMVMWMLLPPTSVDNP